MRPVLVVALALAALFLVLAGVFAWRARPGLVVWCLAFAVLEVAEGVAFS